MEYSQTKNNEFKTYENATEILKNILINQKNQPKVFSKTKENGLESKYPFDGKIGKNIFFTGSEKAINDNDKSQYKFKASIYYKPEYSNQLKHLCNIYRRWIFDYHKLKSDMKETIIIETPDCKKSEYVNTRFEGNPIYGSGVLNVIHLSKEDPNVFVNNMYQIICEDEQKLINRQKSEKLRNLVVNELTSLKDKDFIKDHDDGYQIKL